MSQALGNGTSVGNHQMEWLYDSSSGKPTNDDYLMGKAVDKDFERKGKEREGTEGQINAVEYDCCPRSIFSSQVDHQVDLQRKLQEDPLVALRMKEVDTRKKILDNPLKMREINAYIDSIKKKKHKKEKKRKKHKRDKDSEQKEDKDLDYILLQKLKGISGEGSSLKIPSEKEGKGGKISSRHSRKKAPSSDSSDSSSEEKRSSKKKHRSKRRNSASPERSPKSINYKKKRSISPSKRLSQSSSRQYTSNQNDSINERRDTASRFSPSSKRRSRSPQARNKKHPKKDVDDNERATKLKEMMENANWREEQRTDKVKKHRQKEIQEEISRNKKHDPSFVRKELAKAAESGSVAKRIKSNIHNIQRGVSSMNENFARR